MARWPVSGRPIRRQWHSLLQGWATWFSLWRCGGGERSHLAGQQGLGGKPELTRFKGLGEISPNEFGLFIGESMKLEPVIIRGKSSVKDLLSYYMGKNTVERQGFIIDNLRIEEDIMEEVIG